MKWFFWQRDRLVKDFAHALANDMASRLPASMLAEYLEESNFVEEAARKGRRDNPKKAAQRSQEVQRRLTEIILQVRQFKAKQALGVYRKARLHQIFESRLMELGYPVELAKEVNRLILLQTP